MAAADILTAVDVEEANLVLKFAVSLRTASITNERFTLIKVSATPETVADPFQTINVPEDYNPVSRILYLRWNVELDSATTYRVTISGLKNAAGYTLEDSEVEFTTLDAVDVETLPPEAENLTVIDYSVKTEAFSGLLVNPSTLAFVLESSDPPNGDYYLPVDYNNGRIILKFTDRPKLEFLNSTYIKAQRKPISRTPSRWESLTAVISIDSEKPWVYVDFPAFDYDPEDSEATPITENTIYTTGGYAYFDTNYKYRILVSKELST